MKQRKRRITAAVLSAVMAVTAVTMLPAGQSFAANITAKEFYQSIGTQPLSQNASGVYYWVSSITEPGIRTSQPNNTSTQCMIFSSNGKYYYADQYRKIRLVGSVTYAPTPNYQPRLPLKNYTFTPSVSYYGDTYNTWAERQNVYIALMHNATFAYDYFQYLGYSGYSYAGEVYDPDRNTSIQSSTPDSTIYLSLVDGSCPGDDKYDMSNAVAEHGLISAGAGDSVNRRFSLADTDVAVHEMTHLITQQKLGWINSSTQYGAEARNLAEAYGDIFGELSDQTPEWKIGTDIFIGNDAQPGTYCIRDLANPNSYAQPDLEENKRKTFYTDYDAYQRAIKSNGSLLWDAYAGSTILSHAAYVMAQSVPKDDLAKIFMNSLDKYKKYTSNTADATFSICRKAVLDAANEYLYKKYSTRTASNYYTSIRNAFDAAHVY